MKNRNKIPIHSPKWKPLPKEVLREVCIRDGGTWDECGLTEAKPPSHCHFCGTAPDFRGFQFAHRKHRAMGGRYGDEWIRINSAGNLCYIPAICHDRIDGRDFKELDNIKTHRNQHGCIDKV
jgi:hypothetical protein